MKSIGKWAGDLGGVFTMPDLKVLFGAQSEAALYKKLEAFTGERLLVKVKRGVYAVPDTPLEVISGRINPDSYISTGTVLARNMVIGSVPARKVQAVKIGSPRTYECELGVIEHLSISPRLFFGYEAENGLKRATAEKAFLDVCYYYFKGKRFSFDVGGDMNTDSLDKKLISEYLRKYDKRFLSFFERNWDL